MKITSVSKFIQPQKVDTIAEQSKAGPVESSKGVNFKNKVDSSEISSSHTGSFDDKRLMVAKSSILYDVSVGTSPGKIARLKEAVENGTYEVPTNDLADTILKK